MLKIYGIKNCDTVKKARRFLQEQQVDAHFHDYRTDGLDAGLLARFIDSLGYQALLNTRGTTWRKLDETTRNNVQDAASAAELMLAHPSLIKRPLLLAENGAMLLGFDAQRYTAFIQENR
ncbi:ArsC family reductase [Erwinia sp. OLTSP20]|uniref:ArsC family reductase n=1 Tax=unclassified Erwinia TaxID=2622719 RepID=UPI000C1A874E|nr:MULTISPECIES: ArsC family reductase [unclassified Erwinia]PIJ51583.1 ArsC family reductase [Erwinia sp. OAMSP11]PIJ68925.1 ArsC family reductase [Erwinia sp. OLSSP12]PIJ83493.1 ArsC family reductase [Erwinia sp. OLCASP19]PIJ83584.1 ArsC family reductase [Erwinia sp. OLMDSP33]PIJ86326.1 ArsC family reductase [Erwinia sp. OLMTSP26]